MGVGVDDVADRLVRNDLRDLVHHRERTRLAADALDHHHVVAELDCPVARIGRAEIPDAVGELVDAHPQRRRRRTAHIGRHLDCDRRVGLHLVDGGGHAEIREDGLRVALEHADAGAGAAHGQRGGRHAASREHAEDLRQLARHLFLLAHDVGDHVVRDVEPQHAARAARARHRGHRGHEYRLETKGLVERGERDRHAGGVAIGDRRDKALPAASLGHLLHEGSVVGVHPGDEEGRVGFHAEGRGGGDHGRHRSVPWLEHLGHVGFHSREDEIDGTGIESLTVLNDHARELIGHVAFGPPAGGAVRGLDPLTIGLARAARRARQGGDLEPGMSGQAGQELLARDAGRSDDGDAESLC